MALYAAAWAVCYFFGSWFPVLRGIAGVMLLIATFGLYAYAKGERAAREQATGAASAGMEAFKARFQQSQDMAAKIEALGGANTRFVLDGTQGQINIDQEQLVEQINAPTYIMLLQEWEAMGLLQPCEDPEWWHHEWLTPPRLTVDYGRDGKIIIDQWHRGHITLKSIYGWRGDNWQRQTDQWLDEILYRKEGMAKRGLTKDDLPAMPAQASIDLSNTSSAAP
mgnify:CR=1 FL=1